MVEIGSIIILGILAQWIAWRLKIPAILPLILIGLIVGPFSIYYTHGAKLIEPTWNEAAHHGLFPGEHLTHFVELAIGLILFEGGMTLKKDEFTGVGNSILKLISFGALVTFVLSGLLTHFIIGLSWPISFLFAGLIIVTGPTVIAPILRNLSLEKRVASVLKWEGILIDPIGALVAVLVYEFIVSGLLGHEDGHTGGGFTSYAFIHFLQICLVGFSLGIISAISLREMLRRDWIPHYLITIFTLAFVLIIFVGSNVILADSGLLTVVVAGMVLGNIEVPHFKEIEYFKESLSILLISILFILLSANIDMSDLQLLMNWKAMLLLACIIFFVRPMSVFLSTMKSPLTTKEKLFISWVGPRGIVAAGIASYLGLKLASKNVEGAEWITPLVFMVVLGTVLLNATTAGLVAKGLGVLSSKSNGFLMIGATKASRIIGKYLNAQGLNVVLVDTNPSNINYSKKLGLTAINTNIYNDDLANVIELGDVGNVLAMTSNTDVNNFALNKFSEKFGENGAHRLASTSEIRGEAEMGSNTLFSKADDYYTLDRIARDYNEIIELPVTSQEELIKALEELDESKVNIPLFLKSGSKYDVILSDYSKLKVGTDSVLVYMGEKLTAAEEIVEEETEGSEH
jgi:NhaP-type Na+/H+ or K+/H+ antiporter